MKLNVTSIMLGSREGMFIKKRTTIKAMNNFKANWNFMNRIIVKSVFQKTFAKRKRNMQGPIEVLPVYFE